MGLDGLFKETPSKQMAVKLGGSDKGKTYLKDFNEFLDKKLAGGWNEWLRSMSDLARGSDTRF